MDQVFPEYSKLFSDTFGVTSRQLLSKYPTPEDMLSIDTETLSKFLSEASRGRFGISKASEIQESATNTFGVNFAKDAFAFQINKLLPKLILSKNS